MSTVAPVNGRSVELVLVARDGTVLGQLPAMPVATPWWNEVESVVRSVHEHYGITITVLRLLSGETGTDDRSRVTYLAETDRPCAAILPWQGALDDHPLRHPYARPGGPAADIEWADRCLAAIGMARTGPAVQVRSWNLSSLWRIPVQGQTLWLKVVPPFFAHEGRVMSALVGHAVPSVLAHENGRTLMAEIAGDDFYDDASPEQFLHMISLLVEIQSAWIGREQDLLALGLPDWRLPALAQQFQIVLGHTQAALAPEDLETLRQIQNRFPAIAREIEACGLKPTLVHGDFQSHNVRGTGLDLTILDWGDSGVSHPLLDQTALLRHVKADDQETIKNHWHEEWRSRLPGSDPERASHLLELLAAIHQAIICQRFIDNVEPAEHFYHLPKRAVWLARAAALYRATSG